MSAMIKLWLVSAQTMPAYYSPHDDELFLKLARHIASGGWLGEYNNVTLAKEPFYPFWIAVMFWSGVPLSLSQHLLYVCTCVVFIIAIRPLLRNMALPFLFIYFALLFHPISYDTAVMARVIREGIYVSLALLVSSFAIGILLRKDVSLKVLIKWNIGLGLSFAALWLTREEGVLILPSLFLLSGASFVSILLFSKNKIRRIIIYCIPIILFIGIITLVAGVNKLYYGVFTTCEEKQQDFVDAYGSLLRVQPRQFQQYLQVPRETRERIYAVSPAFMELRQFLEGDLGKAWGKYGPYAGKDISTHFNWALRDAVVLAGYGSSGDVAARYYHRLSSEVNNACDKGLLECYGRHNSLVPIWRTEYLKPLLSTSVRTAFSVIRLDNFVVGPCTPSNGPDEIIYLFEDIMRSRISPRQNDLPVLPYLQRVDSLKMSALNLLLSCFRFFMFIFTSLGIVSYVCHIVIIFMKRKVSFTFIIMTALLLYVLARIFLVSLLDVTTWPNIAQDLTYRASLYPLFTAFSSLSILALILKNGEKYTFSFSSFKLKR
ncbi:MAG: hypothetical protein ABSB78_04510 [Bacteroidota bacterium]